MKLVNIALIIMNLIKNNINGVKYHTKLMTLPNVSLVTVAIGSL